MVIKESFVALLKEKPIAKITIREICDGADINRATFYAHYADQHTLLRQIEEELICDVNQYLKVEYGFVSDENINMLTKILEYIRENADICKVLLSDNGDTNFQKLLMELVRQQFVYRWEKNKAISENDAEYVHTFVLVGCVGIIKKWLDSGMEKNEKDMAELLLTLANKGCSAF